MLALLILLRSVLFAPMHLRPALSSYENNN